MPDSTKAVPSHRIVDLGGPAGFHHMLRVRRWVRTESIWSGTPWRTLGHVVAPAVVAHGGFVGVTVDRTASDHSEWTDGHAVAASVADIVLHVDVGKLVDDERAGRACDRRVRRAAVF